MKYKFLFVKLNCLLIVLVFILGLLLSLEMAPRRRPQAEISAEQLEANSTQQLANILLGALQGRPENPPPAEPNTPKVTLFKDFKLVGPPEFKGTNELIIAQTWITEIEKVFKVTKVNDEQKIDFATFFLKEEANHWWEANKNRVGLGIISWDRFKEILFENYFQISYGSIIFLSLHHIRWIPKLERLEGSKRD